MDKARKTAVKAVIRLHKGGWANLTAKQIFEQANVTGRDKAFAAALFYGTAERLVTLDYLLQPFLKKPIQKMDVEVRAVLETGLYQMLYMDVPPRAAVNEAVKLVRGFGKSSASGLVNAVLRKAAQVSTQGMEFENELERVQVTWSLSKAVAQAVMQAMPQDYEAFLEAGFSKRETCLRVNTLLADTDEIQQLLQQAGARVRKGTLENALYAEMDGGVVNTEMFAEGRYHVQGESSQYVCANVQAQKGMKVLDLCAAPGGKSATLAQMMNGGQGLTACDVRENRVPLIEETLHRLHIQGACVLQNDATVFNEKWEQHDRVLCDVPCSGLGVMASKPDIRYADGANFQQLPKLQLKILSVASRYVKSKGMLIYSTCTIRPQENEEVVQKFLKDNPDFTVKLPKILPQGAVIKNDMVTILPQYTNLDGFFVATLERL